eukprot:maker-scaffold991_size72796-snap-gene-0.8 protein:Tk00554 transcript:maker-scaffold991_size72796-snap-gene-0.8-mRNA-1 annotation:"d-aspartate oxidase-like"
MLAMARPRILIIGCGSVGLNTGLCVQSDIPRASVTIVAKELPPNTTSDVAAGIFRPGTSFQAPNEALREEWLKFSWDYCHRLKENQTYCEAGIIEVPCYVLASKEGLLPNVDFMKEHASGFRPCTQAELSSFQPQGKWSQGVVFRTIVIDNGIFLPWAMKRFRDQGGQIKMGEIKSLHDSHLRQYDVVINCTGLGAKALCQDRKMAPIRGQVFRVKAPWIDYAVYGDSETYIIPGLNYVTLGGKRAYNNSSLDVDHHDSLSIWDNVCAMIPSLRESEVLEERVGLRPHRSEVRVETELLPNGL